MKSCRFLKIICFLFIISFICSCSDSTVSESTSTSSSLGKHWYLQSDTVGFMERMDHEMVVYNDKVWSIAGIKSNSDGKTYYNDIWSSTDGINFSQQQYNANFSHRSGHEVVVFDDQMFLIAGFTVTKNGSLTVTINVNDVWTSTDGITWNSKTNNANFAARNGHEVVVSNNKMWLFAGFDKHTYYKDIWNSTDGITWVKQTDNAAFSYRAGHQVVVFNDKFWLIGGVYDDGPNRTYYNDVWSSTDGINWTKVSDYVDDTKERYFHQALVHDNKIWIIGATNYDTDTKSNASYYNDVYSSEDGVNWTKVTDFSTNKFTARGRHQVVLFNNAFWLYAGQTGYDSIDNYEVLQKDVWKSY